MLTFPGILIGPSIGDRVFYSVMTAALVTTLIRTWRGKVELRTDELFVREMFFNRHIPWSDITGAACRQAHPAYEVVPAPIFHQVEIALRSGNVKKLDTTWSWWWRKDRVERIADAINARIHTAPTTD